MTAVLAKIFIQQLQVNTIIGVYDFERKNKQSVFLDIEMHYNASQAIASDNLEYALDYHKISNEIHDFIAQSRFQLIETMADKVCLKLLNHEQIQKVILTINKPHALQKAKNVSVKITRQKKMPQF